MSAGERPKRPRPGLFVQILKRRYYTGSLIDDGELLDASPAAGWIYGVLCAVVVVGYGIMVLIQGQGWILNVQPDNFPRAPLLTRLEGPKAFWYGWLLVGCGLLLHFHSFWGTHRKLTRYHEPAWFTALTGTLVAAVMFAYHVVKTLRL